MAANGLFVMYITCVGLLEEIFKIYYAEKNKS